MSASQLRHRRERRRVPAPLLVTLALATGCSSLDEGQSRRYRLGVEATERQDWSTAIDELSGLLEEKPDFAAALVHRGTSRFHLDRFDVARKDLSRALELGGLGASQEHQALFHLARSRIERARRAGDDGEPPTTARLREPLSRALQELTRAAAIDPTYETLFWTGYCHAHLQGYDAALELAARCAELAPGRPEHRLLEAICHEQLAGAGPVPRRSLQIYHDLVEQDSQRQLNLLYDHLTTIFDRLLVEDRDAFFPYLTSYADVTVDAPAYVNEVLERARADRERRENLRRIRELREDVARMREEGRFREATWLLREKMTSLPRSKALERERRELENAWSRALEEQADEAARSGRWKPVRESLEQLSEALELARDPVRRAVLRQKIDSLQVATARLPGSEIFQSVQELLLDSRYEDALRKISSLSLENAPPARRNAYHYVRSWIHYQLEQWPEALEQLARLGDDATYLYTDLMEGLCLWHEGRKEQAVTILESIRPAARPDEVLRILGQHHLAGGEHYAAMTNLQELEEPTRSDLEALSKATTEAGVEYSRRGEWDEAISLWRRARRIAESQLQQRAVRLYLLLGQGYWETGETARAQKVLGDLLTLGLSPEEERRVRDAHLYLAYIALRDDREEDALQYFGNYRSLGGQLPGAHRETYSRLVAAHGDYLPLSEIAEWRYHDSRSDAEVVFRVVERLGPKHVRVERTESGVRTEETWKLEDDMWIRKGPQGVAELPIRLERRDSPLPRLDRWEGETLHRAELLSFGETVELPGGRRFEECVQVRHLLRQPTSEGLFRESATVYTLAPRIGLIRTEAYVESAKRGELYLEDVQPATSEEAQD